MKLDQALWMIVDAAVVRPVSYCFFFEGGRLEAGVKSLLIGAGWNGGGTVGDSATGPVRECC